MGRPQALRTASSKIILPRGGDGIAGSGQGARFAIGDAINFDNTSLLGGNAQSSLDVADSTFSGNQAIGGQGADGPEGVRGGGGGTAYGGAIFLSDGVEASVASSRLNGNQVTVGDGGKGGAGADGGDTGNYGDNTFVNGHGGAISVEGSTLILTDSSLFGNVVQGGNGGQGGSGGNGGNATGTSGGAIAVVTATGDASLEMINTTVTHNVVIGGHGGKAGEGGAQDGIGGGAHGGGLGLIGKTAVANVRHSRFVGNSVISDVSAVGGAIGNGGGTLTVDRTSIVNNRVSSAGDQQHVKLRMENALGRIASSIQRIKELVWSQQRLHLHGSQLVVFRMLLEFLSKNPH